MGQDVETGGLDPVENAHATEPGQPQLEPEPSPDTITHMTSTHEKLPRTRGNAYKRATPGLCQPAAFKISFPGAAGLPILGGQIQATASPVTPEILPEVGELKRSTEGIRGLVQPLVTIPRNAQDQTSDGIGGSATVIEHFLPRVISMRRNILPERAQQIFKQRERQLPPPDCIAESQKHLIVVIAADPLGVRTWLEVVYTATKPIAPAVNQTMTLRVRSHALIGEIIGRSGKCIDSGHVRPHLARQQVGRDWKILVVCGSQTHTGCICLANGTRIADADGRTHIGDGT
jgi:hypothetical protein